MADLDLERVGSTTGFDLLLVGLTPFASVEIPRNQNSDDRNHDGAEAQGQLPPVIREPSPCRHHPLPPLSFFTILLNSSLVILAVK